ncbi:hypothetical protein ACF065_25705 [Streptomyces sp. NPDC015232]|uniref:hypothetical protein n=1 Tax=unclassified Streptomyces TaxID=2593676 RepID=UPI0036FEAE08
MGPQGWAPPLRAELLNWLARFADLVRLDVEDGAGTAQDLAAARAARPALQRRIADFCDDADPLVREAALAAVALPLADPVLASAVPRYGRAIREVLAESADSSYRWIARERLTAWGEDVAGLVAAEDGRHPPAGCAVGCDGPVIGGSRRGTVWRPSPPENL